MSNKLILLINKTCDLVEQHCHELYVLFLKIFTEHNFINSKWPPGKYKEQTKVFIELLHFLLQKLSFIIKSKERHIIFICCDVINNILELCSLINYNCLIEQLVSTLRQVSDYFRNNKNNLVYDESGSTHDMLTIANKITQINQLLNKSNISYSKIDNGSTHRKPKNKCHKNSKNIPRKKYLSDNTTKSKSTGSNFSTKKRNSSSDNNSSTKVIYLSDSSRNSSSVKKKLQNETNIKNDSETNDNDDVSFRTQNTSNHETKTKNTFLELNILEKCIAFNKLLKYFVVSIKNNIMTRNNHFLVVIEKLNEIRYDYYDKIKNNYNLTEFIMPEIIEFSNNNIDVLIGKEIKKYNSYKSCYNELIQIYKHNKDLLKKF